MELAPQAIMMSSKEIAELVGKKHPHVIRDIWSNIEQLYDVDKDDPKMDFNDFKGISVNKQIINGRYVTSEILLDRRHTEILITGYDVKRRAAVIDRWIELEKKFDDSAIHDLSTKIPKHDKKKNKDAKVQE